MQLCYDRATHLTAYNILDMNLAYYYLLLLILCIDRDCVMALRKPQPIWRCCVLGSSHCTPYCVLRGSTLNTFARSLKGSQMVNARRAITRASPDHTQPRASNDVCCLAATPMQKMAGATFKGIIIAAYLHTSCHFACRLSHHYNNSTLKGNLAAWEAKIENGNKRGVLEAIDTVQNAIPHGCQCIYRLQQSHPPQNLNSKPIHRSIG